jgi:competence protein ComEA
MQLPRVGPKTAQRIVAFREEHGSFQRPEDLMNVKGIGEKTFLRLRPYITVDDTGA